MEIVHENTSAKIICHTPCYKASAHSFHWHENYEICQVLHNPCRFLIDGRPVQADEGDILAIDDYSVHRFLIDHDDTRVRILQFPAKLLLNADVPILPLRPHIPAAEIRRIANLGKTVDSLLSIIEQEDSLEIHHEDPFLHSIATSLYYLLMRHFSAPERSSTLRTDRREFYRITEYVNEHFTEELSVLSLSKTLCIPRGRLAALFLKYSGVPLGDYLGSLRIHRANDLISQGIPITQAAMESGFQSIRTFNHVYRKRTGTTPTDFLHKNKADD